MCNLSIEEKGPYIFEVRGLISPDLCRDILENYEGDDVWSPAESGYYRDHQVVSASVNKEIRDVEVRDLGDKYDQAINKFQAKTQDLMLNETSILFDWFSPKTVSRYTAGSHIKPHRDTGAFSTRRVFTFVSYLNEGFEGGEIFFPDLGVEYRPLSGRTVCFLAEARHGVRPIVSGSRYAIVFFGETKAPLVI